MERIVRFTRSTAFRRGFLGTSSGWLGVWVLLGLAGRVRRLLGRDDSVVERIVLKKGEAIEIRDTAIPRRAFSKPGAR